MVRDRRNFIPGGTYFFAATLADRTSSALVHHVDVLRMAFRIARQERPFTIDAIVILPDRVRDWPYSSFQFYVRHCLLPADWAGDVDEPMIDFDERKG
jgi:hypothetical protein